MAGRYEDALKVMERQTPDNYDKYAWVERAASFAVLGRKEEAEATVMEALRRYPDLTIESMANEGAPEGRHRQGKVRAEVQGPEAHCARQGRRSGRSASPGQEGLRNSQDFGIGRGSVYRALEAAGLKDPCGSLRRGSEAHMASEQAKAPTAAECESSLVKSGRMTEREAMSRVSSVVQRLNQQQRPDQYPDRSIDCHLHNGRPATLK